MAIRTTKAAVEKILEIDEEIIIEDIDFDPFIETANNIVEQVCLTSGYSEATLELIERWLAAHFYCILDPRSAHEGVRGIEVTYQGRTYTGLRHTSYGQQAMLIDTAGNLKILDDNKKVRIRGSISYIGESQESRIRRGVL